jgi:hypothetical protein
LSLSGNGGHIKVKAIKQIRWIGIKFAKAMLGRIKSVFKINIFLAINKKLKH